MNSRLNPQVGASRRKWLAVVLLPVSLALSPFFVAALASMTTAAQKIATIAILCGLLFALLIVGNLRERRYIVPGMPPPKPGVTIKRPPAPQDLQAVA